MEHSLRNFELYVNRADQAQRISPVLFIDGEITETMMVAMRMMIHAIIEYKSINKERMDPEYAEKATGQMMIASNTRATSSDKTESSPLQFHQPAPQAVRIAKYIIIVIRSPGGDMIAAMSFINILKALESSGITLIGVVNGIAYSAGFMILSACKYRYMLENSHLMCHESKTGIAGTESNLKRHVKMLKDYSKMSFRSVCILKPTIIATQKYQEWAQQFKSKPFEECVELMKPSNENDMTYAGMFEYYVRTHIMEPGLDTFFNVEEACDMGLVHGVLTNNIYYTLMEEAHLKNHKSDEDKTNDFKDMFTDYVNATYSEKDFPEEDNEACANYRHVLKKCSPFRQTRIGELFPEPSVIFTSVETKATSEEVTPDPPAQPAGQNMLSSPEATENLLTSEEIEAVEEGWEST